MKKSATIHDIARRLGVSPSTVSRALNSSGYVSPGTRERVLAAAEEAGFHPNVTARSLRIGRTGIIGLAIPDILNPFYAEIARRVQDRAEEHGYTVMVFNTDGVLEKERKLLVIALSGRMDGLIFFPTSVEAPDLKPLLDEQFPTVLFDSKGGISGFDVVALDDYKGARLAVEHLIAYGHHRIGFLATNFNAMEDRLRGLRDVLSEHGLSLDPDLVAVVKRGDPDALKESARKLLYMEDPPSALFAANDAIAIELIRFCAQVGIKVPDRVSIVGFDDIDSASVVTPALTTVAQPKRELGTIAANMLVERIEHEALEPRRVILAPRLVVRDSTCALSQGRVG